MPLLVPPQKPAAWYATHPLRGTGKSGNFKDEDFLCALQISKTIYQKIKLTCIQMLDEHAENTEDKLDLRKHWKGRFGGQTKATMLDDLIRTHADIFDNTNRFQLIPSNWNTVKRSLAELCFVSANAYRSRQLPNVKQDISARAPSSIPSLTPPVPISTDSGSAYNPVQPLPSKPQFPLHYSIMLNNIVIPVIHKGSRADILPHLFQKSDAKMGDPQYIVDVSLDRLMDILAGKFRVDGIFQVWGMNSLGSLVELKSDDHLAVALIRFILDSWVQGCQRVVGLEVRCLSQSTQLGVLPREIANFISAKSFWKVHLSG